MLFVPASKLGSNFMIMDNKSKCLAFLYHEAVDDPNNSGFQRKSALPYKHKVDEFRKNIDTIASNCRNITTIDALNSYDEVTLLTFDDGGKSSMLIAEYLEKYDFKGHFFVTTSLIGDKYFLREDEIVDLHKRGHIIGSHTHTHPNVFKSLTKEEMLFEWTKSRTILENLLKTKIKSCSIPGGDANVNSYASAKECGYEFIFDSVPTYKLRKTEGATIIGRICPKAGTSFSVIKSFCEFKGIKREYIIRKIKNLIKIILFPIYSKIHNSSRHGNG